MPTMRTPRSTTPQFVRRTVNQRFLLLMLSIVVAASVAFYFLHTWQVDRNSDVFRERAEAALEKGKAGEAITNYTQYLGFRPDDTDARAALGKLIEDNATSGESMLQAYLTYEKVLLQQDNRDDIRQRLVDVAMKLGRFSDAEYQIEKLLPSAENRAELEFKLGVCAEFQKKPEVATTLYRKAIEGGYRKPPVFLQLVDLLNRELNGSTEAERLIDQMVEANPDSLDALLVRARFRLQQGKPEEARRDLAKADEIDPGNIEIVLLRAEIPASVAAPVAAPATTPSGVKTADAANEASDPDRSALKQAIERAPEDERLYLRLSQRELTAGHPDAAIEVLRSGIAAAKSSGVLIAILGDVLISQGKLPDAEQQLIKLRQMEGTKTFADFLDARLHVAKGELPEALSLFRKVQPQVARIPQLNELCSLYAASCFESMGERSEQIAELRQALAINPDAEQTAIRLASALQADGRDEEALGHYRKLVHVRGVPLEIARIEFQSVLRQSPERRDWPRLEAMLQLAAEQEDSLPVALLRHQILMARGQSAEALDLLKKLHAETPSEEVTGRLSQMLISEGDLEQAKEVIEEAKEKLGDTVPMRIARALWVIETEGNQADEALGQLESGSEVFSSVDQFRLFSSLADLHELRGAAETANRLRGLAAERRPFDLRTRVLLMESASARGDKDEATRQLQELRQIVGADSPQALAAEAWLLVTADNASQADLDKAVSLLSTVSVKKSDWYRVPLLLAVVNEKEGNLDLACQKYREAIELGHREPRTISRLIGLYSRLARFDEIQRLLNLLSVDSPPSLRGLLGRMKAEVALNRGETDDAIQLVGEAVAPDSKDPQEHVWLGAIMEKLSRLSDAEVAYRKAVLLDPHHANGWIALISFLNRTRQSFESELAAAREQLQSHADSVDLARLFEAAGEFAEAETSYKQQLTKDPGNAGTILAVAGFYQRTAQADKAEPYLRSLLKSDSTYRQPVVEQARRSLASVLVSRDYKSYQEALALLDANIAMGGDKTNNLLLKASVLAVRPGPANLRDAMLILQDLDAKGVLNSQSRALLAQLYDAQGERQKADQHWQQLLGPNAQGNHIALYVRRQLQNGNLNDVPPLLTQLQKLEPNVATELTFRWHVQSGHADAGVEFLTKFLAQVEPPTDLQTRRVYAVAELVERVAYGLNRDSDERRQLVTAAEAWYQEVRGKVPEATLGLARLLGRAGRISEALRLCEEAMTAQSSYQVASVAMQIVRQPEATPSDVSLVEKWLKDAAAKEATSGLALVQLGEFGFLHGRYQQSLDLYEALLQRSPDNAIVLNNLAWLLSMWKGDHDRAEKLIDRAIAKAGPVAALLDTRGTIRLNRGDYEQAIADFREAVATDDSPLNRVHLALACWKDKKPEATRLNFSAAIEAGFRYEDLLPLEQKAFEKELSEMQIAMDSTP